MKVPASSLIYPKIFVTHLRLINTGHPDAAETLVSDNVKEMSNPTRDGRAMINNDVYTIGPNGEPEIEGRAAPTPAPRRKSRSARSASRAEPETRPPSSRPPLNDGRNVQVSRFQRDCRVGGRSLGLSGCATNGTTGRRDIAAAVPTSADSAAASVAQRDLTPAEKKAIVEAVAPSLRNPASAKYRWAKFPRS